MLAVGALKIYVDMNHKVEYSMEFVKTDKAPIQFNLRRVFPLIKVVPRQKNSRTERQPKLYTRKTKQMQGRSDNCST